MTAITRRPFLLGAAGAAFAGAAQAQEQAPAPPDDPLLVQRRTNLPKTLPWPVETFQPQAPIPGGRAQPLRVEPPGRRTVSAAALAAAEAYAQQTKSTALLIQRNGRLQHAWFAPGTSADTISHSYNMHYTPLVLLVGIAIAEGRIGSVDDRASKYLPEWRKDARSTITLRNLLQMHSGLDLRFDAHYSKGMYSRDARAYWGSRTKEVILNEYPLLYPPGTRFDYNYIVPDVLGVILERTTGRPYPAYLSEKLWKPLGNRTAFVWLNRPGGEAHQDAGLFSAPADWLNVAQLILDEGMWKGRRLVPRSWIAEMRRPSPTNPNFGFMYLGSPHAPVRRMATDERVTYVVKSAEPFLTQDVTYIDGYGGQRAYISPSRKLVVVRMGDVARDWDNTRLVNAVLRGLA